MTSASSLPPLKPSLLQRWRKYLMLTAFAGSAAICSFTMEHFGASAAAPTAAPQQPQWSLADTSKLTTNEKFFAPVLAQLLAQGADTAFVRGMVNDARITFHEKLVKITVPVRKTTVQPKKKSHAYDYAVAQLAIDKSEEFLNNNDSLMSAVEKKYAVPKEAVTAIMWVETRFGTFLGNYHVPSVYLSFAMASENEYIEKNRTRIKAEFTGTDKEWEEIEAKIQEKARKKSDWAVKELLALQKMHKVSPIPVMNLYGSWAGAFGLSQFLPSSYMKLATDGNGDGKVNLFDVPDAAHSIGRYLSNAGWGNSKRAQHHAVYNYNHSDEYVNAVLGLAKKLATSKSLTVVNTGVPKQQR